MPQLDAGENGLPQVESLLGRMVGFAGSGLRGVAVSVIPPYPIPMPSVRMKTADQLDIRERPSYPLAEAGRYLKVPAPTVRSWAFGRHYETADGRRHFPAIFRPASRRPPLLSFWNLIEAHVLRALRTDHGVSVQAVRAALATAEKEYGVQRLLLSKELLAGPGKLFLDRYGQLIELTASRQLAMRQVLVAYLKRIDWDEWKFPVRLYPFLASDLPDGSRTIAIDPTVAFGRPIVARRGITTAVIAERVDAGETVADLAVDYELEPGDIEQAILYEHSA